MKITIKKKGKQLEKLLKNLQDLNNSSVEIGHFQSQGTHYSGMTYPELLQFWARGIEAEGVSGRLIQDARAQWVTEDFLTHEVSRNLKIKTALDKWYRNLDKSNPASDLLDEVGVTLREEYKDVFGIFKGPYMAGTETPMLMTGDLKEHTAYKTSKDNTIKN